MPAWRQMDAFRADRGHGLPNWPDWCFLPMSGFYAILSDDAQCDRLPLNQMEDVARLAAMGTWRVTQGIYRFDPAAHGENGISDLRPGAGGDARQINARLY